MLFYGGAFVECARRIAPFRQVFRGIRLGLFNRAYDYAVRTRLTNLFMIPVDELWDVPVAEARRRLGMPPGGPTAELYGEVRFRRPWRRRSGASGRHSTSRVEARGVGSRTAAASVQAGWAGPVADEEQKDQHVQQWELAVVLNRGPALRQVNLKECHEHLDGQE